MHVRSQASASLPAVTARGNRHRVKVLAYAVAEKSPSRDYGRAATLAKEGRTCAHALPEAPSGARHPRFGVRDHDKRKDFINIGTS